MPQWAIWASAVFALAAGFRPSTALLLAPLWLLSLWRVRGNRRWLSILTAAAVTLLWFVPMPQAARRNSSLPRGPGASLVECSGASDHPCVALVGHCQDRDHRMDFRALLWIRQRLSIPAVSRIPRPSGRNAQVPLWVWLTPGLLFFGLVFLNFVNSYLWCSALQALPILRRACTVS